MGRGLSGRRRGVGVMTGVLGASLAEVLRLQKLKPLKPRNPESRLALTCPTDSEWGKAGMPSSPMMPGPQPCPIPASPVLLDTTAPLK